MRYKLLILFLTYNLSIHGQKEYSNWYFGDSAAVSFLSGSPVSISNSKMYALEGCSSISDENGNLLFYTNGEYVWNKEHKYMDQLFVNGLLLGGISSTQAALIVQQPRSKRYYYIFTTDMLENMPYGSGVNYSVVDMYADSGRGSLIVKNQFLFKGSCEKIAATLAANKEDIWIAAPQHLTDTLFVFKLGKNGLSSKVIKQNTGRVMNRPGYLFNYVIGQMKFSPNGKHLAYGVGKGGNQTEEVYLFDFNTESGLISNSRVIQTHVSPYGLEFSPNSQYLFLGMLNDFCQVKVANIKPIQILDSNFRRISQGSPDGLQLGPDGKIYHASWNRATLSCIENPDSFNSSCVFKRDIVKLTQKCLFGLPSMVSSLVIPEPNLVTDTTCVYDSAGFYVQYKTYDSLFWDFGDGRKAHSTLPRINYKYNDSGAYTVQVFGFRKGIIDTLKRGVYIRYFKPLFLGKDTTLCYGDSLVLQTKSKLYGRYLWSDGSTNSSLLIKQPGNYSLEVSDEFCKSKDSILVKFGTKFKVFIGNDTVFCYQFQHVLSPNKLYKHYNWNTGDSSSTIVVNKKGEYILTVLDSASCASADSIQINQLNKPKVELIYDTVNCQNIFLKLEPQKDVQYIWFDNDTAYLKKISQKGSYSIEARNQFCSTFDTVKIQYLSKPDFSLGHDTELCGNIVLSVYETGKFIWNTGQVTSSIRIDRPGLYWLQVMRNKCSFRDSIYLSPCEEVKYYIPNAFSPNGDVFNDVFKIEGEKIKWIEFTVFNTWGELIFNSNAEYAIWDGQYKGLTCPQGVYFFQAIIKGWNGQVVNEKGHFTLLR